jgi:hypothetical protein
MAQPGRHGGVDQGVMEEYVLPRIYVQHGRL